MSSKAEVTAIITEFDAVPMSQFIIKAAQKAFKHVTKSEKLHIQSVFDGS